MKIFPALLLFCYCFFPVKGKCFGVLSHEAIIDAAWDKNIVPLLKIKYPNASAEDLKTAHAYAYGGAVTPDMGYYPFGSIFFSDLVHYVRSGDLVNALLKDANNLNQYAFALGFLSHYYADNYGHPIATNRSVPLTYPKLYKKYGRVITYGDDKISHMRMEFGFDVLEIANGSYASESYHNFIGFKVDTAVLSKAFFEVYGLDIDKVFKHRFAAAVEIFRFTVANIFPLITKAGWASKNIDIVKEHPNITRKNFVYKFHIKQYKKEFGTGYKGPGFFPTILSVFIRFMPKIGPLRPLKFKMPTPLSEKYLHEALDTIFQFYSANLNQRKINNSLPDKDYDTGKPTIHCEYRLADESYDEWVLKLKREDFKSLDPDTRHNILKFYSLHPVTNSSKKCSELSNDLKEITDITTAK